MKYLKTFEALKPSQFRRYVKLFDKSRYDKLFKEYKEKYSGDRNAFRIYLPLEEGEREIGDVEKKISEYLDDRNIEIVDYVKGTCKYANARNTAKIGQVLTKLEKQDPEAKVMMKSFVEDPVRKTGAESELEVCISRHPYDIAGSDTGRDWTNCMTLPHAEDPKVKRTIEELNGLKQKRNQLQLELEELSENFDEDFNDEDEEFEGADDDEDEFDDDDEDEDDEDVDESYIYENAGIIYDKELAKRLGITEEKFMSMVEEWKDLCEKIRKLTTYVDGRRVAGLNARYLICDVKEGSLISYLIKKNDKNIQNPIAVLNIKPYLNENNPEDVILVADPLMYGKVNKNFRNTVTKWLEEVNKDKKGIFRLNKNIYNDQVNPVLKYGMSDEEDEEYFSKMTLNELKDIVFNVNDKNISLDVMLKVLKNKEKEIIELNDDEYQDLFYKIRARYRVLDGYTKDDIKPLDDLIKSFSAKRPKSSVHHPENDFNSYLKTMTK